MSRETRKLGSISAGNKDFRIFRVLAILSHHTVQDFSEIRKSIDVKNETILDYLKTIQQAQNLAPHYAQHLEGKHWTEELKGFERKHADNQLKLWRERSKRFEKTPESRKQTLRQYLFEEHKEMTYEAFFKRLEQAILLYSFLTLRDTQRKELMS